MRKRSTKYMKKMGYNILNDNTRHNLTPSSTPVKH